MFQKVDGTTINDAEVLNLVLLMYNLLEYSLNCSDSTGSLCFQDHNKAFKFFKYKGKLLGYTLADGRNGGPSKYLSKIWISIAIGPLLSRIVET